MEVIVTSPYLGKKFNINRRKKSLKLRQLMKNLSWLTLCRCTSRALEAFNLASFLDFPEPSNDMSFNEALIINCGAWDGPDVDISSETKQRGQTKRLLFSESVDAFVISSNIWTFFSELKIWINLLRNVLRFDSFEAWKGKKAALDWLAQP